MARDNCDSAMIGTDNSFDSNFKPREIGTVNIEKPGRYTLAVKPKTKAKAAVMDLRQVTLKPAK